MIDTAPDAAPTRRLGWLGLAIAIVFGLVQGQ